MKLKAFGVEIQSYIGYCCREWVLFYGVRTLRCGLCGERPRYLREDER